MLLLWLGLYQLATGSSHCEYSLFMFIARPGWNIARFAELQFWSLRGTKCHVILMNYQYVPRLLRFARNDNMGIMQSFLFLIQLRPLNYIRNILFSYWSSPQQAAGNLRLLRKMFIFYSLANPAASSGECARCSVQVCYVYVQFNTILLLSDYGRGNWCITYFPVSYF